VFEMFDLFLKLVRQELSSRELIELHPIKIGEYKAFLRNILKQLIELSSGEGKYLNIAVSNILSDVDLLVKLRIMKIALGSKIPGESIDKEILEPLNKLIEFTKSYLAGLLIEYENNIAVIFKSDLVVHGRRYKRGDVTVLPVSRALELFIQGYIDVIIEPSMKRLLETRKQ